MIEQMGGGIVGGGGGSGRVKVITGKGCSRLFVDFSSSFRGISSNTLDSLNSTVFESSVKLVKSNGPFSGLVICVTGLSKETRKQVKEATERLGGQYSPNLHPQCTHLVVQSFRGRKFQHALKHGPTNGLFLVTIGWFVDSVRRNVRLDERLYNVNKIGDNGIQNDGLKRVDREFGAENSCPPIPLHEHTKQPNKIDASRLQFPERESKRQTTSSSIFGQSFYIDNNVPAELQSKVGGAYALVKMYKSDSTMYKLIVVHYAVRTFCTSALALVAEALSAEGASLVSQWFVGCNATHIVCEGPSVQKYLGHSSNLVTPLWVLKTAKEKSQQRLVHLSSDLARCTGAMLDTLQHAVFDEDLIKVTSSGDVPSSVIKASHGERQIRVTVAKDGVRKRRNRRMQTCQTPIRPITPGSLLDSICWSISEPTSTSSIYTESSSVENSSEDRKSLFFDGKETDASFVNLTRPLTESEKSELIFKGHFLTIMFPVDRFSEMGPCSRTFFSDKGFTCLQVLDHIYAFYQENMSDEEIEIAIHTDSRPADRLRSSYSSKETAEIGRVEFKRVDFLGSRKSFEMLKRVSGDNNSNLYELLIRA